MLFSDEIDTFLAVVQAGSLLQAAEIVCTTQSTVSYRIKALEQRLGHALLLRSRGSRGISLTSQGERFLDIAQRWRMLELEAEQIKVTNDRYLAIGTVDVLAIYVLSPFLARLANDEPAIRLHVETGLYWQLTNRVASGHLSAAFTVSAPEHADLVSVALSSSRMVIARSSSSNVLHTRELELDSLELNREIYVPWSAEFDVWRAKRGLGRQVSSVEKSHLLPPLLQRPGAWAVIPAFMARRIREETNCTIYEIKNGPPPLTIFKTEKRDTADLRGANSATIAHALHALRLELNEI
jgi:DNA-binding transcriptional LysR family regulator